MTNDRIEKSIDLKASPSRVWKALTDSKEFGTWFGCRFDGPFVPGKKTLGALSFPGFEHYQWALNIQSIQPETLFSFTWNPYPADPTIDYTKESPTLIEFRLEPRGTGTHLTVTESGFTKIPEGRRLEAFRMNTEGWVEQLENLARHVD